MSATSSWTLASFSGSKGAMLYSQYAACTIGVHMVPPFFLAKKHGKWVIMEIIQSITWFRWADVSFVLYFIFMMVNCIIVGLGDGVAKAASLSLHIT
jgi:hypothetical protein